MATVIERRVLFPVGPHRKRLRGWVEHPGA